MSFSRSNLELDSKKRKTETRKTRRNGLFYRNDISDQMQPNGILSTEFPWAGQCPVVVKNDAELTGHREKRCRRVMHGTSKRWL